MKIMQRRVAAAAAGIVAVSNVFAATYTDTIAQVSAYITNQMAAGNIPGLSIALVDGQEVVWTAGFGRADREQEVPADADTVYHIGSCSKAFLGTTFMQLLDQARVNLDAPVTNYIPEFSMLPRFTNSGTMTVRSLLNHHSGLPGDFFNGMWTARVHDNYTDWLIACLREDYPFAAVNERYFYCNTGFVLGSEVVRRIAGVSYPAFSESGIFAPLGMASSSFLPDKAAISNRLAAAYNAAGTRQPAEVLNCLGSGSMYSTANDLSRYIRMILADGWFDGQAIVSSNGIDVMTTPQLTNLPLNVQDAPQGLGWDNVDDYRFRYAGRVFWKDGAVLYHCSFLGISRDLQLGVAVIQNTEGSQCDEVGAEALRWAILEKTGQHWPTNAFVPAFSPPTNRPQAELDALAGLYVGDAGYHQITAQPGALTLALHAHTDAPQIFSNLVPRANGWFSPADAQRLQLAFTNLAGHDMLVLHMARGAYAVVEPVGERFQPPALSAAWRERTNRLYRAVNMFPDDYFWDQPGEKRLYFWSKDGALLADSPFGEYTINPQNDHLAFQAGVHYRKGGAVRVMLTNGYELLQHSSYRYLDEAAIATLPLATVTNGAIPFANGTRWFWFNGRSGTTYRARLTAPGRDYYLRLTDYPGAALAAGTNAPAVWTCNSNGLYAIAVSATNVFAFDIALTAAGCRDTRRDFDGDGLADPASWQAGQWRVALSGAGYAWQTADMGAPSAWECAADYDGDGRADPAVYDPGAGRLLARLSMQGYALFAMELGLTDAMPVIGDFDSDGRADPALYAAGTGRWSAWLSGSGYAVLGAILGGGAAQPAAEDYDGDGRTDPAVFDPPTGRWTILLSGSGYAAASLATGPDAGARPIPGDYDGDGKADPALYQPASGRWLVALSRQGYNPILWHCGAMGPGWQPQPGDYDNDGKSDPALCDAAAGIFCAWLSGAGYRQVSLQW